jgi:hypothetical protein
MFQGLKGTLFSETKQIVEDLSNTPLVIQRPPDSKVMVVASDIYPPHYLPIGLDSAVLLRGPALSNFLSFAIKNDFIPKQDHNLNEFKLLSEAFDIRLSFDEQTQNLLVNQIGKSTVIRMDNGSGAAGSLSTDVQIAIGALAVLPEELWNNVRKQGLIVGALDGDYYDKAWKVKSYSLMIDDFEHVLSYSRRTPDLLLSFHPEYLRRQTHGIGEKTSSFLASRQMVGIFADLRTADPTKPVRDPIFA